MQKTIKVTIDGEEYELTQLGAVEGKRLLTRLLRVAGPALGELATGELNERTIAAALSKAAEELDDATFDAFCDAFAKKSRLRQGDRWPVLDGIVFDQHFAGRYLHMLKWMAESLKLNFADFLGAVPLGNLARAAEATSK